MHGRFYAHDFDSWNVYEGKANLGSMKMQDIGERIEYRLDYIDLVFGGISLIGYVWVCRQKFDGNRTEIARQTLAILISRALTEGIK